MFNLKSFFLTHGRGLKDIVKMELKHVDHLINFIEHESEIEGKILFKTSTSLNDLKYLKTCERLLLNILFIEFDHAEFVCKNKLLEVLENRLDFSLSLPDIYSLFNNHSNQMIEQSNKHFCYQHNFRVNCKLTGSWRKIDVNLRKNITNIICSKMLDVDKHFHVDLTNPHFEIICHLSDFCICVGIPVSEKPLSLRTYLVRPGLRSTICAAMLLLAECIDSDKSKIIIDPFCGKSTLIAEYFGNESNKKKHLFICSDADADQINDSVENLSNFKRKDTYYDLITSNLTQNSALPFRNNIADLIISDLPFGHKHIKRFFDSHQKLKKDIFYKKVITEFDRVLISYGIICILINEFESEVFEEKLKESNHLDIKQKYLISLGKTNAIMYKIIKTCA
jgi:23S rRNA G2445 N2-methylase RlmL